MTGPRATRRATAFTREEFMRWFALLDAALDQPHPTPALRRALRALTKQQEDR